MADYCDALTPCFHKPAFGSMALAYYAKTQGYEEVELCGLVSNICVISNAVLVKAALPEARVSVDARCTACADPAMNDKALVVMEGLHIIPSQFRQSLCSLNAYSPCFSIIIRNFSRARFCIILTFPGDKFICLPSSVELF